MHDVHIEREHRKSRNERLEHTHIENRKFKNAHCDRRDKGVQSLQLVLLFNRVREVTYLINK